MAKQLNVNLAFSADTGKAKAQIQELQSLLNQLSSNTGIAKDLPITGEIMEAQVAAKQLSTALGEAFNVNTGKLDLSKFSKSLSDSKMTLTDYSNKLSLLGKEGDQAFLKLANSIISTEAPLKRTSSLLTEMGTTLKNTVRWQLSSSILHGFMGSIQSAYNYAQDLNKSLNNIRIVTGQSTEQMAEFAKNANKAAKELSTTTTAYTNAALIYYQQGDDDATVLEKTDVTAKMANVTGTSSEEVSDQLTAIWNNFNKSGEESYEKYADILTALGAATASSTDEIAGGLEKFASIADMIGLSYEYAASALATITATTRQSEDVVGTALKTIFARIQGLNLGETLEDGTTLNKYSEALMKVGISIKNQNGELKDMDQVLNEMGSKWKTLSKDQQVALAQTVAGVRQYNQLVSLMDSWDFMEENLDTAYNAEGTLNEQAEIYAESWEAASKRVKASLETIYNTILKDDFFIGLTDTFGILLEGVDGVIDSVGGLKGVLFLLGTIVTSVFQEEMASGINNALYNFTRFTGVAQQEMQQMQQEAFETAMAITKDMDSPSTSALRDKLKQTYELQVQLRESIKNMTPEQAESARQAMELAQHYADVAVEAAKAAEKADELLAKQKQAATEVRGAQAQRSIDVLNDQAFESGGSNLTQVANTMINQVQKLNTIDTTPAQNALRNYQKALHDPATTSEELNNLSDKLITTLNNLANASRVSTEAFNDYQNKVEGAAEVVVTAQTNFERLRGSLDSSDAPKEAALGEAIRKVVQEASDAKIKLPELTAALKEYDAALATGDEEQAAKALEKLEKQFRTTAIGADQATDAIMENANANEALKNKVPKEALREAANNARQYQVTVQGAAEATKKAGEEAEKAKDKITKQGLAYKTLGSAITGTVQGFSSFALAISSLSSLFDTLKDENLSGFEKALRIVTTFGMVLPAVTSGVTAFGNAWKFAKSKDITEGLTAQVAKLFGVKVETIAVTNATNANTTATEVNTKATWGNVKAKIAQQWWLLAIAAGVAVLATALTVASNMYNKDAIAAEKAAEAAKNASEEFQKAQETYNQFKAQLDDYTNGVKGLHDLTEGTIEYREALLDANEAAMKLIDTAGLIYGQDYEIVDGIVKISDEALQRANEAQLTAQENAMAYRAYTRQQSRNASLQAKETEFNREYVKGKGWSNENSSAAVAGAGMVAGGALLGLGTAAGLAKLGAAIGTAITPGIGTAIGAGIGAIAGIGVMIASNIKESTDEESRALRVLQTEYEKVGNNSVFTAEEIKRILKEEGGFSDKLIDSLADANVETQKMVQALSENTAAIKASIEQTAGSANRENQAYQNLTEEEQELANKIIARESSKIIADTDSQQYKDAEKANKKLFDWSDKDAYSEYLKARYGDEADNYRVTNQAGTNATLQKKNEDGSWENVGEKNSLSNDEVIRYLTERDIQQYNEGVMKKEIEQIQAMGNVFGRVSTDDGNGNKMFGIDPDAIKSIESDLASGNPVDLSVLSPEQVNGLKVELENAGEEISLAHAQAIADAAMKYDPQAFKERMDAEAEGILREGASQLEMETESLEAYTDHLMENSEVLADNKKIAAEVAVESARFSIGLDKLEKALDDNIDTIKKADKTNLDYFESLGEVQSALEDAFGVEIDSDFIENHLEEIQAAATGDIEAVEALRELLAQDIICNVMGVSNFDQLNADLQTLATDVANLSTDIEVGAVLNDGEFLQKAQNLVTQTGMSVEEAQNYFNSLGYEPTFETTEEEVTTRVPQERTHTDYEITKGFVRVGAVDLPYPTIDRISTTYIDGYKDVVQTMEVPALSADGAPKIKTLKKTGTSAPMGSSKSGGGSGGSKGKKGGSGSKGKAPDTTKKTDIVERYKEINDQLDNVKDTAQDVNKETDRLYGADKIASMKKQNALILEEKKLLEAKRQEAKKNLEIDREALKIAAQNAGLSFEFDGNEISNYTSQMTLLYEQMDALKKSAGETVEEAEQEAIDNLQKKIDELKDAINMFEDTRELIEDLDNEIQEKFYEWQDSNYEILQYALEVRLELNEDDLKSLDYYLNKYSDNFYKMAESAELLNKQIPELKDALSIYENHKTALDESYEKGEISQEAYIEGLREVRDGYYSNLESLIDLDKQMLHYYEDTLSEAKSELDDFTDHMEHLTGVFDHYLNLLDILGRSKDFEAMNDFLSGKAETLRDRLDVAKEYYEMLLGQKADAEEKLNAAIAAGDEAAIELYKEEWDAIVDEVDAAQEEVLNLTEEWTEAMKAVIENNMAKIADTLEKTLTGGTSFDTLMDEFDKLNTRQEEYLTKTNQIYETNKLMRTASKALDETDNKVAKQKLKNFIDETKSLQENTKLSQYELEIQQAKYDLLLAEIALEEAQNAKTTVRLSRDNEGNFGYVYTADQDAIDDAQQAYEDADNRLYNLSLEGQQEFTEKYIQATQEMYNQLTELQQAWLNGEIASEEEYERRKEEILNHYLGPDGVLTTYQNLYNIAVRTDADATADNWQKDYAAMTQNTEDWKVAVNDYLIEIEDQTAQWAEVSEQANEDVEDALDDTSEATENLTDESENLKDMINDEVVPAIEKELDWVREQTEAYADQREELLDLIETYEDYIDTINQQIEDISGMEDDQYYDKNTDYSALMMGYLAAGGSKSDDQFKELQRQREAKIDGEGYTKEKYGTRGSEFLNNIEENNTWYKDKNAVNAALQKLGISTFSTGGYTGDWGPEGKLAILHEKEVVLNAEDTSNLLHAVSFIRDIISMIDSQASSASLYNLISTPGVTSSNEVLEQMVTIHAEFPNATNHNEIEEAFNNLVNRASQYANRK